MKMKWPDVDQYIQDFERIARKAEYPLTEPATVRYFMKGLTRSIVNDIVKPPKVNTYAEIKQRAIDSVASQLLIFEMFKQDKGTTSRPPSLQWNRFAQPNPTNQQPSRPNIRGYNSTNVPQHLNNAPSRWMSTQTEHEPTETTTGGTEIPKEGWSKCKTNKETPTK
jgi:hypothetical protein